MILHLRVVPGFGLAVEARTRPELWTLPVIMGGSPQSRGAVREASFAAQARGVQPGLSLTQAHQHCPEGLFLTPDDALYAAIWGELCRILRAYTPLVEPLVQGQAVLDLSGCPGAGDEHAAIRLAGEIARTVRAGTGIIPWLGLAANRLVAELASQHVDDDGMAVIPAGRERAFLADLPLTALPEVDARLALTFQILGLRTIGQFAALPRTAVRQRFGVPGERLHTWSRGADPRRVVPPAEEPAVRSRGECDEGTLEDGMATLQRLAEECAAELQHRSLAGTLITLTLIWAEGGKRTMAGIPRREPVPEGSAASSPSSGESTERLPAVPSRPATEPALPVAYRIHSVLPQPGNGNASPVHESGAAGSTEKMPGLAAHEGAPTLTSAAPVLPSSTLTTLVRTPIAEMSPLFERARELLLRHWPRGREQALAAVELAIGSFEQPVQLAFAELNRLDGIGVLRGMDAARRRAFEQTEDALATRYSDTSFRRLAHLDPANILTERRFQWER